MRLVFCFGWTGSWRRGKAFWRLRLFVSLCFACGMESRGFGMEMWLLMWQLMMFPLWSILMSVVLFVGLFVFVPWMRIVLVAYMAYILVDQSHSTGGSDIYWDSGVVQWMREGFWWKWVAAYFPLSFEKTTDLDPRKPYLFACHPHGVIAVGVGNMGTNATNWRKQFPDVRIRPIVLKMLFYLPFFREWLLMHDVISADSKSIERTLSRGHSICLIVGGAKEALEAHPRTMRLVLRSRRGFLRLAVRTGASLVPVLTFGENDLFDQVPNPPGSRLRTVQEHFRSRFGFSLPIITGRSLLLPLIPKSSPVNTVFGAPVPTIQTGNPTDDQLSQLQAVYIAALENLYHTHKSKYGYNNVPIECI